MGHSNSNVPTNENDVYDSMPWHLPGGHDPASNFTSYAPHASLPPWVQGSTHHRRANCCAQCMAAVASTAAVAVGGHGI